MASFGNISACCWNGWLVSWSVTVVILQK